MKDDRAGVRRVREDEKQYASYDYKNLKRAQTITETNLQIEEWRLLGYYAVWLL
jgi:hypothetical protein